ncbi:MAG: hypothetical protein QOE69_1986 [Thermoleophilaceae bacterium]|nr:hypothetical protein [Thermoleophilaceae bacterium]
MCGDAAGSRPPVAIDIPIGLPETVRYRRCDEQARELLGGRRDSVFPPPARYMLEAAGDYTAIRELVAAEKKRNPAARGYSAQAAGITTKVREVDAWVCAHPESEAWLFECHPELSFYALNDGGALPSKHSAAGLVQRLGRIRELFPDAEAQLADGPWSGKQAAPADFLDAYGALGTALVCARHDQEELGDGERDVRGVLMRMAM